VTINGDTPRYLSQNYKHVATILQVLDEFQIFDFILFDKMGPWCICVCGIFACCSCLLRLSLCGTGLYFFIHIIEIQRIHTALIVAFQGNEFNYSHECLGRFSLKTM